MKWNGKENANAINFYLMPEERKKKCDETLMKFEMNFMYEMKSSSFSWV